MSRARAVNRLMERYGQPVQLEFGRQTESAQAFLQPLRYKNRMYVGGSQLDPGYVDGGHYLYIGPGGARLDLYPFDAVVRSDGQAYTVKRAEAYRLGEELLYIWAILQRMEEETEDA